MLTLIFIICMFVFLGKVAVLAMRGAWGLTKILFSLILLPFVLLGLVFKGLIVIAIPALIIYGLVSLLAEA